MMVRIRALTTADIPAGQRLREQAGWNQTADDWQRLLHWDASGCWVAEPNGPDRPCVSDGSGTWVVGTTAVTGYGSRIAWVGMVLVDEAHRRQGIGQALLTHALAYLEARGVQTVALDSTPAGQPLYARLGFVEAFELARWRGPFPSLSVDAGAAAARAYVRRMQPADLPDVSAYDARLFGTDRAHILAALQAGHPATCVVAQRDGHVTGYALSRPGARAWHLGPVAADDRQTAAALAIASLAAAAMPSIGPDGPDRPEGPTNPHELVMDVVMPNSDAVQLAQALGLSLVRPFIRMTRGAAPPAVDLARLYTSAGPELG
jgi:predicted N-acetyltransferase YhbS